MTYLYSDDDLARRNARVFTEASGELYAAQPVFAGKEFQGWVVVKVDEQEREDQSGVRRRSRPDEPTKGVAA